MFWINRTPLAAGISTVALVLLLIFPVLHVFKSKIGRVCGFVFITLAAVLFGWKIWPPSVPTVASKVQAPYAPSVLPSPPPKVATPTSPTPAGRNYRHRKPPTMGPVVGNKLGGDGSCQANAIGGDAKVENCKAGPPEAKVSWKIKGRKGSDVLPGNATVIVELAVDQTLDYPAFFATCDRPCHVTFAGANGLTSTESILKGGNEAGAVLAAPRPLGPGVPVDLFIAADDNTTPSILMVGKIPRADVPDVHK
jgi:hypothetical protein